MLEILKKLESVQELDLQIDGILRKKADFPKRLAGFEAELKTLALKYDEKKKIVDEFEKNKRQQTGALELNEERLKRSQGKQEQIKDNREFQALQKEVESLKKHASTITENSNKVSDELKKHNDELQAIETRITDIKGQLASETSKIASEEQLFDTELTRLRGMRGDAAKGIDNKYLAAYDRIRGARAGLGIVPAIGGCCKGCNMRIAPQTYIELQRGSTNELFICPNCKRIQFYKETPKTA